MKSWVRRPRAVVVIGAVAVVVIVCAVWLRGQSALERRIPEDIKQRIVNGFKGVGTDGVLWRGYHEESGGVSFVAVSWSNPFEPGSTYYDVYRIDRVGDQLSIKGHPVRWRGEAFEATGFYLLTGGPPMEQRPYEHTVVGMASDKRTAKITVTTRDGRTAEALFFDGFWCITAKMDPADYVADKWVSASAFDSAGKLISTCVPVYWKIPSEDSSPPLK